MRRVGLPTGRQLEARIDENLVAGWFLCPNHFVVLHYVLDVERQPISMSLLKPQAKQRTSFREKNS